ncbi:hypothetical protein [Empedobacter brevis]|uniref:hypothetical protein n=1 Tax=Empedobacter brevis TaxID=247 RepID=UPI002FE36C9C
MNKNFTFKCMALVAFTLMGFKAQAQYYADGTPGVAPTKSLTVDTQGPDGASPDGTTGSWYRWNPNAGTTTTATYTAGDDPDGSGLNDSNKADITWNATWPTAPTGVPTPVEITALIKDYKITAEEFNSCQPTTSTGTSKTEIDVKLVKPDVLFIDADNDICSTAKANITLYGTSGAVVNYTINGGDVTAGGTNTSATLNSDGKIDIEITPSGAGDVVFVINNVTYTATQPAPLSTQVTFTNSTITNAAGKTVTIKLNAGPVISPIAF